MLKACMAQVTGNIAQIASFGLVLYYIRFNSMNKVINVLTWCAAIVPSPTRRTITSVSIRIACSLSTGRCAD